MSKWALMLIGTVLLAALAVAGCSSNSASEDDRMSTATGSATALSAGDRQWVMKAAQGGMTEVQMGQMIQQRASNEDLRRFGQRLVNDHQRANQELMDLASRKGVQPPTQLDMQHRGMLNNLSQSTGRDFDREAVRHAIAHHEQDIAEFERAARSADDAELRAFAARTLPTLRQHLAQARDIASQLGLSTTGR